MTKSKGINQPKKTWTELESSLLLALYPCTQSQALAGLFNCSISKVYARAKRCNLKKSTWFKNSPMSSRLNRGDEVGKAHRYQKGNIPANKGVKGMPSHPNSIATQFKAGQRSKNWRPVGSTRIDRDGYVLIKMSEGKFKWEFLHRMIWQRLNGAIDTDYLLSFIDSNKKNCNITNLSLVSKKQHAINNSVHKYGPEIAELYRMKSNITKEINKRERAEHEQ
jgi:hypothetical protein